MARVCVEISYFLVKWPKYKDLGNPPPKLPLVVELSLFEDDIRAYSYLNIGLLI